MFLRSFTTVGGWTLTSRIIGFAREILISKYFGSSILADMLVIAIRIPGAARELFSKGITAAFIPQYSEYYEQFEKDKSAKSKNILNEYSFQIIIWTGIISLIIVILAEIFMPQIIYVLAPGYRNIPNITEQVVLLSRIGFVYFYFITIATVIAGILSIYKSYIANSAAPAISNILLIVSLLLFSDKLTESLFYFIITFLIGGIAHLLFVFYEAWRKKVLPRFTKIKLSKKVKKTIVNSLPTLMATGVSQINILISTSLASTLSFGAISILFYTDRIIQLPIGIIGISLYTIMIPSLSRSIVKDKFQTLRSKTNNFADTSITSILQIKGISYALIFSLPSCIGLYFLAEPIVFNIYVRGNFTIEDGNLVVSLLKALVLSIPIKIVLRPIIAFHHAKQKYSIPLQASILAVAVHLIISLSLISTYEHLGIIIGLIASAWCNTIYQWWRLPTGIRTSILLSAGKTIAKILPALIILAIISYFTNNYLIDAEGFKQIIILILMITFLAMSYLYYCYRISLFKK